MPVRSVRTRKAAATVGFAAPVLGFTCILLAIASYPKFSWTSNALSDLGVVKGLTGPLFNFGLYASGFLGLIFAVFALYFYLERSTVWKVGSLMFALASVMLVAIGVFNESYSGTHFAVSVAFFVLAPISFFIFTCAFAVARQKGMAIFTVMIGVVAAAVWILQYTVHYVTNVAVPETISGLAVSTWIMFLGYRIAKQAKNG